MLPLRQDKTRPNEVRRRRTAASVCGWLALAALPLASTAVSAATFTHRTVVTIDRTKVPGVASLTNFPVLVSVTSANLKTTANSGFVTSSRGYDIIFQGEDAPTCAPAAPPCRLDHEIESYDGVNGVIVAWVRVPAVFGSLSGANTPIYMYYGDATVTGPQENKTGVWDASYREVFHLNESGDHTDSTVNAFTAVGKGAVTNAVAGRVGGAVDLAGGAAGATPAWLIISDGKLSKTTSFTLEAWVYFRSYVVAGGHFIGFYTKGRECLNFDGSPVPQPGFCTVEPCGDWATLYKAGINKFSFGWAWGGGLLGCKVGNLDDPGAIVNTGQWYHVVGTYDLATKIRRLYVNGVQVVADAVGNACLEADIPHYSVLGSDNLSVDYLDGMVDEVRMSTTARSAAWVQTSYNNQSNPNFPGFYSSIADQTGGPWTVGATAPPSLNPCFGGSGTCYLRSIGNTAAYTTGSGTCTATNGSSVVSCPGATWVTANRGRGDRITIDATDYMVLAVDSETQLRLSAPFTGVTGVGNKSYTLSRQFATPQAWEDCISTGGAACSYFPVANGNLVTGTRSEIGIIYKEASPYTAVAASIVNFNGSTTDASHTITLTADGVNRHYGIRGSGVLLDNGTTNLTRAVVIADQFVTVEWLEVARGGDPGAHCIDYVPSNAANHAVIRNNIVRNCSGQSIRLAGTATDHVADINNNFIFRGAREGVRIQSSLGTGTGSLVRIFNNTFFHNAGAANTEISTAETPNPYVVLRNNIFVDDAQAPDSTWNGLALCTNAATCDWWSVASGNNITGDAAPPTGIWRSDIGPSPRGGGIYGTAEASVSFINTTPPNENLHLMTGSPAYNRGSDLTGVVSGDIDAQMRLAPWDVGADELPAAAAPPLIVYSDNAGSGTRPLQYTTYGVAWATPGTTGVTGSPPFHTSPLHQKAAVTSPTGGQRAAVWTEDNPGDRDYLYASFWNGTNWDDGAGSPFGDAQTGFFQPCWDGVLNLRCFDAAYEQLSGRLLVAYGVNTVHTIRYRRYDTGVWSAETSTGIPASLLGAPDTGQDGTFAWVHLAPRPGTNQIAFLGIEDQISQTPTYGAVTAAIWDGNSATWGSKQVLSLPTTNGQNGHLTDASDIKFVLGGANLGEAIAVWGNGQQVYSARWSQAGGWTAGASIANLGAGNLVRWLRLAAKPQGDGMVLAIEDTNQRIYTQTYNGTTRTWSAVSAALSTTAYGSAIYNRPFDLVWDTAAGANNVLLVYSDTTRVRYRTSSDGGATWTAQQTQDGFTVRQAYWVQLVKDPSNVIHFALQDAANALQVYTWNGTAWLIPSVSVSANMERDANHAVEPFAIATYPPQSSITTAVKLVSFSAVPGDGSVVLEWRTGSELDNQGFHVYRGATADGPWTRLTSSLIPGLGSSPLGKSYSWRDSGLVNGQLYYYRLEDVDTRSKSTFHGPVSAMPSAAVVPDTAAGSGPDPGKKPGSDSTASSSCPAWVLTAYAANAPALRGQPACTRHGDPEKVSLEVVSRDTRGAVLELRTGGFYAVHAPPGASEPAGTVRLFVPGFDQPTDPKAPALPLRRALVDAPVGRKARLAAVAALEQRAFSGLRPAAIGQPEMQVGRDGTIRPQRQAARETRFAQALVPQQVASLAGTVFQGEAKSAVLELSPLRFDTRRGRIVLAGRVRLRLDWSARDPDESGRGSQGRRRPRPTPVLGEVLAELHASRPGVDAVAFETLFPRRAAALPLASLSLERQGTAVPFHVEPAGGTFGPGSVLYFYVTAAADSTAFTSEVAYQLVRATGVAMDVVSSPPQGETLRSDAMALGAFERNRIYQPGLLDAEDAWQWESLPGGVVRVEPFTLAGVDTLSPQAAELTVYLQGATDAIETTQDHHVRVSLNGIDVGETYFDGKRPERLSATVPVTLLREGPNELAVANVGDTGVSSFVFLDRFSLAYPQQAGLRQGTFEGTWPEAGTAALSGASGPVVVLDVTDSESGRVSWVRGVEASGPDVRFRADALRRYVVASPDGIVAPRVVVPPASTLRDASNQADYLLIAPQGFLAATAPLVDRRQSQGLRAQAVSFEEIASVFGGGQPSAEAIHEFLRFAYHSWSRPSPRYVLLVGDSTYDPRNFTGMSLASPLPALWTKTTYLVTASDPLLAAVNGEDALPDLAIGRLPARTPEEADRLVQKLIAWEDSGQDLSGPALLVADNPDVAGDFEADVRDVAQSFLAGRKVAELHVSELGPLTRPAILDAFNSGLSLAAYVGHGGAAVWASENVLNSWDTAALQAQSRQPLLVTMNCLNGYFVAPNYDALGEAFVKADGRGAIAGFSPSGLSLDEPAQLLLRALMAELTRGSHERLGDAVLAAQRAYAETGAMPELLSIYHLFGDPALRIRR